MNGVRLNTHGIFSWVCLQRRFWLWQLTLELTHSQDEFHIKFDVCIIIDVCCCYSCCFIRLCIDDTGKINCALFTFELDISTNKGTTTAYEHVPKRLISPFLQYIKQGCMISSKICLIFTSLISMRITVYSSNNKQTTVYSSNNRERSIQQQTVHSALIQQQRSRMTVYVWQDLAMYL